MAFGMPQPRTNGPAWQKIDREYSFAGTIKRKDARIADLEVECERLRDHIADLRRENGQMAEQLAAVGCDEPTSVPLAKILRDISRKHGFSETEIRSASRQAPLVTARQEFCYLACLLNHSSMPQIGKFLGNRDHTTILHGVRAHCARNHLQPPRGIHFGDEKISRRYAKMLAEAAE